MSTPSSARLDVSDTLPVPFGRLTQVELRKMADTRAGTWLLVVIGVITVLAVALLAIFGSQNDHTFENFLGATGAPQGLLLPVLGVLLITSEWGQRSALTTFTLVPRRSAIVAAKVMAAIVFGLAAIAVAVVVAAVAAALAGGSDTWAGFTWGSASRITLLQSIGILQGLAFGMLFLNSAAAIVSYFVLPMVTSIVTTVVPVLHGSQPWIDPGTAQEPLFGGPGLTGEQWMQLLVTTLIWVALPMAIGATRILRSEVK